MTFEFKKLMKYFLPFLILLLGQNSLCYIEEEQVEIFQNNIDVRRNTLGEHCLKVKCSENQICNETFECECRPGFTNYSNVCVPCAGENEKCLTSKDCVGMLRCINGVCRKDIPNAEFFTLAKVCLGITITSIIVALLSSLLKCILRFDSFNRFRQCGTSQSTNYNTQGRHVMEAQPAPSGMQEEKPPSYEECMITNRRSSPADPPPPYVIYSNDLTMIKQNYVLSVRNTSEITSPSNIPTILDIQPPSQEQIPNRAMAQKTMGTQSS